MNIPTVERFIEVSSNLGIEATAEAVLSSLRVAVDANEQYSAVCHYLRGEVVRLQFENERLQQELDRLTE